MVTELQRMGIDATEEVDGFLIRPGQPQPSTVQTYSDHRMAMSFAVTGLVAPGIEIADPECVNKTFPTFWDLLPTALLGQPASKATVLFTARSQTRRSPRDSPRSIRVSVAPAGGQSSTSTVTFTSRFAYSSSSSTCTVSNVSHGAGNQVMRSI